MDLDDNLDLDEKDDLDLDEEPYSYEQATSKRVKMITSIIGNPNRIDILKILNLKGSLSYAELKSLAGFKTKKDSGKFAYHLRKLLRQSLVALKRSERVYTITKLGKLVTGVALQIEESGRGPDSSKSVNTKLDPNAGSTFYEKYIAAESWREFSAVKGDDLALLKKSEQALKQDPEDTDALRRKGYALGGLGRYEEAIKCFDAIITLDPEDTEALHWKASALGGLGRFEEAFKCFTQSESRREDLRVQNYSLDRALWQVDFAKKHGLTKQLKSGKYNRKLSPKKLVQEEAVEQKSTQHYAGIKAWQTIRKNQTKQAIIDFLSLNPESRNGDIWKHTQANKKTSVSLKMFNSYLAELVDEAQVKKMEEEKPGRKYPRYSLVPQPEREKYRIFLNDRWIENVNTVIDRLDRLATKIDTEIVAERMYAIYSVLVGLLGKQKIMEKFSDHKLLTNQTSHQSIRNLKRSISVQMESLFGILDRLSAKKRKTVLDTMIYLSERDYLNNLADQGVSTSDLMHKMIVEYAQNLEKKRLDSDYMGSDFWDE